MAQPYDADRRAVATRGRTRLFWDVTFRALRLIGSRAKNAYAAFGIFLLSGAVIAGVGTWGFAELAGDMRSGKTQAFDDAVMRWLGSHQSTNVQNFMLEMTTLGTGTVVGAIVRIAGVFLRP